MRNGARHKSWSTHPSSHHLINEEAELSLESLDLLSELHVNILNKERVCILDRCMDLDYLILELHDVGVILITPPYKKNINKDQDQGTKCKNKKIDTCKYLL
ncbi:hypothetical protein GUJ93_ZPchr0334g22 [Zizania palustris]|uniref:Uncharacterized protein n=1 Tax=Zizania palustris TaxID=103762 RepID=A0A8J5R8M5_ZIZPA|nr:hypothetical protein GUJ93_ZPchr0334g22 [Zizania palustris]